MKPERWNQVDRILDAALELDAEKRAAFLKEACAGDETLRKEVESLLASDDQARSFIEAPASELGTELLAGNVARLAPGEMIGPYEILSPLGKGGMGEVFRARDTRLEREVAIKILAGSLSNDKKAMSRFAREAKALAALSHSNIIAIHDFGSDQGVSYAVMELLKGQTLRERLTTSKLKEKEALEIGASIANGLCAAHSAGVIHRDLKPENIFLTTEGGVKILDFGLARRAATQSTEKEKLASTITRSEVGVVVGTVPYMSPEQVRAERVDVRTDIFSFGVVLYEMLSGERLFARKTPADTVSAILNEKPPRLPVSLEMNEIIQHCLEKNPDQRFQSARDLLFALKTASTGTQIVVSRPSTFKLRKRTFIFSLIAVIVLLAIGIYRSISMRHPDTIDSIAVLPVVNNTGDSKKDYLSDGITENLIRNLSGLTNIRVIARNSVFRYKNKPIDPLDVGKSLNVQTVILGNLAMKDDMLLIDMRMVDVHTNRNLWTGHFRPSLADIHIAQEKIANQIAEKLYPQLSSEDRNRLTARDTDNSEAYVAYLMGRYFWNERDLEKAIDYFKQATALDPDYAMGYVGIASSYAMLGTSGYGKLSAWNAQAEARAAAMKTLEIKNTSPESRAAAHAALGFVLMVYDWNWQEAERQYQQAIQLNANDPTTRHWYAIHLTTMGRFSEAIAQEKRALETDPLSLNINAGFAYNLIYAREYEQARKQCLRTLSLDSAHPSTYSYLGMIYEQRQMYDEAIASFQKAVELSKGNEPHPIAFLGHAYARAGKTNLALKIIEELKRPQPSRPYISSFLIGLVYAGLGKKDEAFFWLEKAYEERSNWMPSIKTDPLLDNLRSDPRFATLERRMGFPQHIQ